MSGDNPIGSRAEDRLGRARFADELAVALRGMHADRGVVVGLMAPWGYGKTSVLNLVAEQLATEPSRTVLTFNPWMFSGTDQLVQAFFEQLAAQLRLRGRSERRLADWLVDYGQAVAPLMFVPVAGVWLARAGAVAAGTGKLLKSRKKIEPITVQRDRIEQALRALPEPLIVVLDDIDRLTPTEIRDIVRLVRLTAHFPNIVYLLAFDRGRVERALGDDSDSGRAYLEKIIEFDFDLPAIPESAVLQILVDELSITVADLTTGPFDEHRWPDVLVQVFRPLFRTVREVNRYLAVLPATLATIGDEVALVDVLALEAIRVRRPDLFARLLELRPILTQVGMLPGDPGDQQALIHGFLDAAGDDRAAVASFLRLLFPATERHLGGTHYGGEWLATWRRERRVASPEVLAFYLNRVLPADAVTAGTVDLAVAAMTDPLVLQAILDGLDGAQIEDLLTRLDAHLPEVGPDAVEPASSVLLGLYPRVQRESTGFLDLGADYIIDRVVLRLLRRIPAELDRARTVESLCASVASYFGRLRLLDIVGSHTPTEPRLIPATENVQLLQQLCHDIRHAGADALAHEPHTVDVLAAGLAEDPADRAAIDAALTDVALASAVLRSALDEVRSQPIGSVAVHREPVLRWETLATVVGDNESIGALLDVIEPAAADDPMLSTAMALARRYLAEGPPPLPLRQPRPFIVRTPQNSPHSTFSPPSTGGNGPALTLRALTTYELDPAWDQNATVSGREFHDLLARLLSSEPLPELLADTARQRGFTATGMGWQPDPDAYQTSRAAVSRQLISTGDGQHLAMLRYGVFLPDQRGPARLIADVMISLDQTHDEQWFPLALDEAAQLHLAAIACVADPIANPLLARIFDGEVPTRSSTEVHLGGADSMANGRRVTSLADALDLSPLGAPSRPDQPPRQGMFAVSGDAPLTPVHARKRLLRAALERMARDWGYLDVPPGIPELLP